MMSYEETMQIGEREYKDVIDALARLGLKASFTQTGGMNAALEIPIDGGARLLVTDAEDSLPWSATERQGWGVGLYADEESQQQLSFESSTEGDLATLAHLIQSVLRSGVEHRES